MWHVIGILNYFFLIFTIKSSFLHQFCEGLQNREDDVPSCLLPALHSEQRSHGSGSRFSHVGFHFLSTGAAVNSSESLPPSSSVNDISSMSTDQTLASDTDSSLEASAGPLGCCRWLAACLRNPAFFRRWRDRTQHTCTLHTHTQFAHTYAYTKTLSHMHKNIHAMSRK